jgi:hypothetical protein
MKKGALVGLVLMLVFAFATIPSFAENEKMQTIEGNIVCLLPDYEKGSVKPVIATEPCDGLAPHAHVLVTKEGTVYSLQGLQEGLMKIERSSERKTVKITGRVEGNQNGWILYVM